MKPLRDKVAVVTGATRGCGRAIAVELGRLGATVFVTGRTTREQASPMKRPETIEETAELVDAAGGRGIPVRCDYTSVADVDALRERVESEGRLDILVDDVWGGDQYLDWDNPYWESSLDDALTMVHNGIDTHLIALHRLLPLLTARPGGLVLEVTDGDTVNDETYPGPSIPYYLVKAAMRTLGRALGVELAKHGCVGLTVTPGFLRSEAMLEYFKVTEETWRDAITSGVGGDHGPHFAISETPYYLARGVAALALDPDAKRFAGKTMASWTLKREYGFTDLDGTQPDWGHWHDEVVKPGADPSTVDTSKYR